MQIPYFPEANHPLVKALFHHSDQELLTLCQNYLDQGRYFTAIFCRYSPIVYTLISHGARSPVQADYLFAQTWRHIFHELRGLDLRTRPDSPVATSLQNWLINMTAYCINQIEAPPVEQINYSLQSAPVPLWCYLEQALSNLSPSLRLMVVMSQTFHWSESRIAAYLQAEGEQATPSQVKASLQQGYKNLEMAIPPDIREIYFTEAGDNLPLAIAPQ